MRSQLYRVYIKYDLMLPITEVLTAGLLRIEDL
jgi:hypothetical protein